MKRNGWLFGAIMASTVLGGSMVACGGDGGGHGTDGGTDTAVPPPPPSGMCPAGDAIPDPDGLMGACCYRASNADRLDNPKFRIAGLKLTTPSSISNSLVRAALNGALDEERFNWLIEVVDASGSPQVKTGYGVRNADATFSYNMGTAPAPGDVNRWDPVQTGATLDGESVSTAPLADSFTVPILEDNGTDIVLEFPLQALELVDMTMSEDRTCVGSRLPRSYDTTAGFIRTFITIEDAMAGQVVLDPINTSLCNFIAGMSSNDGPCTDVPQGDWSVPPDAKCDAGVCTTTCDAATDCNAWTIEGEFAAHGVDIN